jgi:DNA-binding MarR family transcriptional regulator
MARQMPGDSPQQRSSGISGSAQEQHDEHLLNTVSFHIYRIAAMWTRLSSRVYGERFGVSVPELRVLRFLAQFPGATNSDICHAWSMDKGLSSRTVTALHGRGLVLKNPNPDDRRMTRLNLSAAGQEAVVEMEPIRSARLSQLRAKLEPDEYEILFRIFAKIEAMLGESQLLNEQSRSDDLESQVAAYLDSLGVGNVVQAEGGRSG